MAGKSKKSVEKSDSTSVLVATYRPNNVEWIKSRKLYNLPLPKCGKVAFHERVSRIVLIAEGFPSVAYKAKLRDVVDRGLADKVFALTENSVVKKNQGKKLSK